jgi:hypothetical protein
MAGTSECSTQQEALQLSRLRQITYLALVWAFRERKTSVGPTRRSSVGSTGRLTSLVPFRFSFTVRVQSELVATVAGEPPYSAYDFSVIERIAVPTSPSRSPAGSDRRLFGTGQVTPGHSLRHPPQSAAASLLWTGQRDAPGRSKALRASRHGLCCQSRRSGSLRLRAGR